MEEETRYDVFVRDWWRIDEHGQKVPGPGEMQYLARNVTYDVACAMCKDWNDRHDPGPLSRMAEFISR